MVRRSWSLVYYGAWAAAGRVAKGLKSHSICAHVRIFVQHHFQNNNSLPYGGIFAGRALQSRSISALLVRHEVASARPAPSPFETALAPSTSALSAEGISHNPAATATSVTLGTSAAEVAAPWPPPTWPVTGRISGAPVRAADYALSAVYRAPAPQQAMLTGSVLQLSAAASLLPTISPSIPTSPVTPLTAAAGDKPPWLTIIIVDPRCRAVAGTEGCLGGRAAVEAF